jgi:hypothetical protein
MHKQLMVYVVLDGKNYEFLGHLCLEDPNLPLIHTDDEKPNGSFLEPKLLFSICDEGRRKSFAVNLSGDHGSEMRSMFRVCKDEDLRNKFFIKMLTELSKLPSESFAP